MHGMAAASIPVEQMALPAVIIDRVVSSYALHHLRDADKAQLVADADGRLRPTAGWVLRAQKCPASRAAWMAILTQDAFGHVVATTIVAEAGLITGLRLAGRPYGARPRRRHRNRPRGARLVRAAHAGCARLDQDRPGHRGRQARHPRCRGTAITAVWLTRLRGNSHGSAAELSVLRPVRISGLPGPAG